VSLFGWTTEIPSAMLWAQAGMSLAPRDSRLGRGWSSIFRVARGEEARSLIAHHVSLWMDGSDHLGKTVGLSPGCPRHFATRGWKRLVLDHKSCEGRGSEEPQSHTTCPSSDGRLRSPRRCCGPRPECPRHLATHGWEEAGPRYLELQGARR
jgi:hypothetical protein